MAGIDAPIPLKWEQEFAADPSSVAAIRRGLSAFARAHRAPAELVGDLALAVSEAVTNAVVHAFTGIAPGTVRVRAEPGDGSFHVVVADDGTGMMPRGDSPGLGLGLPTIAQLTTSFDIRSGEGGLGTEVSMVFEAPGVTAPPVDADGVARRFELLGEVTRLAGAGWPAEGVERLLELLVPAVADAGTIDLIEPDGPRRVAARIARDADGELTAWLAARRPPDDAVSSAIPALRAGDVYITALAAETNDVLAVDPADVGYMEALALASWVNVPLIEGGVLLGTLGLGLGADRAHPEDELPFYTALGERAARGLASTQLVEELRRTRRRLERVLSVLSEAVTVQDGRGRTIYANEAAIELLGAASLEEVRTAAPGELAGRFVITHEDGRPVQQPDLPGDRVLAGEPDATLLTRSVAVSTGAERWLLTKATLLEDGEPLAVNIIEDITEAKNAELRRRVLAEAGLVLAEAGGRDAQLTRIAALAVPALADWCAIDVDGRRVTECGAVDGRRTELAVPIGAGGTLHLATHAGGRALDDVHRAFAAEFAGRLAPALDR